jgi:iron complex outermembrane receptor protein
VDHPSFARHALAVAFLSGCPALSAYAQDASAPPPTQTQLQPIDVNATQASYQAGDVNMGPLGEKPVLDTPYSVYVVNNDLARNQQLQSVREALRFLPSVQGENIRPQSRGLQAGVVQNTRIDGLNIAATTDYPIEEFEQIEVLNGLAGALYGPASPAGTFNYVFKRPTTEPLRELDVRYSSRGSATEHLDFGGRFGDNDRYGYRLNLLDQNGGNYVENSRLKRELASLGFDVHFTPSTVLENDASFYRYHTTGFPGTFALGKNVVFPSAPDPNRVGYGQPYAGDNNVTRILSSRLKHEFNPDWHLTAGVLRETNDRKSTVPTDTITSNSGAYTATAATTTFSYDLIVSNAIALNGHIDTGSITHDLLLADNGFYWSRYTPLTTGPVTLGKASLSNPLIFAEPDFPDFANRYRSMNTTQQALTLGDTIGLTDQWSTLLAASQSWINVHNYNKQGSTTASYNANGISPTASVMYKPTHNSMAYLTYADSLQQGDSAPAGTLNAGDSLAPYRSRQWELGYKIDLSRINFTAAIFRIQRPYAFVGADNVFAEQGRQVNRGIELGANGDIGRAVTIFAGVSLLDPKLFDTGSASTSGKQILGLSRVVYNVLSEYHVLQVPGLTFSANVNHATRRPGDFANTQYVDGYTVVDLGARYQTHFHNKPVTLRLDADNVGNSHYWANVTPAGQNGYNATGSATGTLGFPRTVRASVQLDLL